MAHSYFDVATRWVERCLGSEKPEWRNDRMFARGDKIYSYGTHFEIARAMRDKRGRVTGFLFNGDVVSVTTTRHQGEVRGAVSRKGYEPLIIPYSALESAGVDLDSVRELETTKPRNETRHHSSSEMPAGARWAKETETRTRDATPEELQVALDRQTESEQRKHERFTRWHEEMPTAYSDPGEFKAPTVEDLNPWYRVVHYDVTVHRLRMGRGRWGNEITETLQEDGTKLYEWETHRHWLGESLIRAKVTWYDRKANKRKHRWATFLSGFDMQESTPLYFFCELPYRSKARTVAEAYEALKPDPVVLAESLERDVRRQGDIFAVPTPSLGKRQLRQMGARFEKRGNLLKTNHVATEVAYLPGGVTMARGTLYHAPERRRPDHARRRMSDGWNIVIKNTVPTTRRIAA